LSTFEVDESGQVVCDLADVTLGDLDDGGALLWIPDSKTLAGRRKLQVPEFLQPYLVELARGRDPHAALFGEHWRDWPRKWVQRICKAAGVPKVSAHGMRGLHGTLAVDSGITSHAVASALGHESFKTTAESYAKREAVAGAQQKRALAVLTGGKLAS
jgi:integrase